MNLHPRSNTNNAGEADQAIDTLLLALRAAQPSPGLERRILQNSAARAAAQPARPRWLSRPRLWVSMAACCVLALALVAMFARLHHGPAKARVPQVALASPRFSPETHPPQVFKAPATRGNATMQRVKAQREETALAGAQLQQASYPAPPLPLTDQERMLLQIAHHRNAANFAALDPRRQDLEIAQANAQLEDFFKRPPFEHRPSAAAPPQQGEPPPPSLEAPANQPNANQPNANQPNAQVTE